jgi:ribA/ribD-fused uncharacterized protein
MSEERLNFYGMKGEFGCFSNFSRFPFKLKNRTWQTSEHYFQAQKFVGTKYENTLAECKTPKAAKNMGRRRTLPLRRDWEEKKLDIMEEALAAKFG